MNFQLTILGSSSGAPTTNRYQTSQYLIIRTEHILIDCGEGTQLQLMKYGLGYMRINHIFISHLHADHYIGLIGLINTMNLNHRTNPLHIYAPHGLDEIIAIQLKYSETVLTYQLFYHFFENKDIDTILETNDLTVKYFPLKHRIPVVGFLFAEKEFPRKIKKEMIENKEIPVEAFKYLKKGENYIDLDGRSYSWENFTEDPPSPRSYAFVTDTLYYPEIVSHIRGVDMLYHEATFMEDLIDYSKERYHSTNIEAAKIAKEAGAGKLLLGHFSTRYKDLNVILEQAREVFSETYLAIEGDRFEIPYKK